MTTLRKVTSVFVSLRETLASPGPRAPQGLRVQEESQVSQAKEGRRGCQGPPDLQERGWVGKIRLCLCGRMPTQWSLPVFYFFTLPFLKAVMYICEFGILWVFSFISWTVSYESGNCHNMILSRYFGHDKIYCDSLHFTMLQVLQFDFVIHCDYFLPYITLRILGVSAAILAW